MPVLKIQGGQLDAYKKGRGVKNCENILFEAVRELISSKYASAAPEKISIGVAGTFEMKNDELEWKEKVKAAFPQYKVTHRPLSCGIACHIGLNAFGISVSAVERSLRV